jgi:citrate synthase
LPNAVAQGEPLPEGLFWLLMTGELPTNAEFKSIHDEWNERGKLKDETVNFILSLPRDTHPMTMLSMAVLFE